MIRFVLRSTFVLAFALSAGCSEGGGEGHTTTGDGGGGGGGGAPARPAGMTDVSILFPLPGNASEVDGLLSPSDAGAHGALLPFDWFELAPDLASAFPSKAAAYAALRAVSARLDPCFRSSHDDPCRPQVRLVFQPLDSSDEPVAIDAAVHVFYELTDGDFAALSADVVASQSAGDAAGPLGVHPAMAREGLKGSAGAAIRAAVLAHAGADRLSRMTFMQLSGKANVWIFGGFELRDGMRTPLGIAGSSETSQSFTNNNLVDHQGFSGGVDPVIAPDDLGVFYDSDVAGAMSEDELWPSYEAALRVENPDLHTADTVSCVACHTANAARAWADRNTELEKRTSDLRFTSSLDLTQMSTIFAEETQAVRAFGYRDRVPAVSQRTIHETATVVERLRAR